MSAKAPNQSYVYFSLSGDHFDPQLVSERLNIIPNVSRRKEDAPKGIRVNYSTWELHSQSVEYFDVDSLVDEVIDQLLDKVKLIRSVKAELNVESVLQIVLYINTNEKSSTPFFGHDLSTIQFLYETQTRTDVDIYRFDSVAL